MDLLVAFRVDASRLIGTGHLMRCLTLADALRSRRADCVFICRDLSGNLISYIESRGFLVRPLPRTRPSRTTDDSEIGHKHWLETGWVQDAEESIAVVKAMGQIPDCLVIDHYGIDNDWEALLHAHVRKIMVIDDLADRFHRCDILLDQNAFINQGLRYANFLDPSCKTLFGPKYALLRPQFTKSQSTAFESMSRKSESTLIFLGGVDSNNLSLRVAEIVRRFNQEVVIDILVGASNQNTELLIARSSDYRLNGQ